MFNKFDKDKSGHISSKEFGGLCFGLGYALTPVEQELAVKQIDLDGSGEIGLNEFKAWWQSANRWENLQLQGEELEKRKAAADAFNSFDSQKTGCVQKEHYPALYADLKEKNLTKHTLEKCLENLDASGDGKIQFIEYINYLASQGTFQVMAK